MKTRPLAAALITIIAAASSSVAQWTVTNLHPAGSTNSFPVAASGGLQAGFAVVGGVTRASLWSRTAASWVDLNPAGSTQSQARAASGAQQAGYADVGGVGIARGLASFDLNSGAYNLTDEELDRIERHLLASHTPRVAATSPASMVRSTPAAQSRPTQPPQSSPARVESHRTERQEALTCGKCSSINVRIIYARDYCLKCEECGKFTPILYV